MLCPCIGVTTLLRSRKLTFGHVVARGERAISQRHYTLLHVFGSGFPGEPLQTSSTLAACSNVRSCSRAQNLCNSKSAFAGVQDANLTHHWPEKVAGLTKHHASCTILVTSSRARLAYLKAHHLILANREASTRSRHINASHMSRRPGSPSQPHQLTLAVAQNVPGKVRITFCRRQSSSNST